jgi:hypothetical protein
MKMYYMNDTQQPVLIRIMDLRYDPATGGGDIYVTLQPTESQLFDLVAPANHIPYLKNWGHMLLMTSVDPAVFAQTAPSPAVQPAISQPLSPVEQQDEQLVEAAQEALDICFPQKD